VVLSYIKPGSHAVKEKITIFSKSNPKGRNNACCS
jgi:hypothetical protein